MSITPLNADRTLFTFSTSNSPSPISSPAGSPTRKKNSSDKGDNGPDFSSTAFSKETLTPEASSKALDEINKILEIARIKRDTLLSPSSSQVILCERDFNHSMARLELSSFSPYIEGKPLHIQDLTPWVRALLNLEKRVDHIQTILLATLTVVREIQIQAFKNFLAEQPNLTSDLFKLKNTLKKEIEDLEWPHHAASISYQDLSQKTKNAPKETKEKVELFIKIAKLLSKTLENIKSGKEKIEIDSEASKPKHILSTQYESLFELDQKIAILKEHLLCTLSGTQN